MLQSDTKKTELQNEAKIEQYFCQGTTQVKTLIKG
jgi:hypothetical protein